MPTTAKKLRKPLFLKEDSVKEAHAITDSKDYTKLLEQSGNVPGACGFVTGISLTMTGIVGALLSWTSFSVGAVIAVSAIALIPAFFAGMMAAFVGADMTTKKAKAYLEVVNGWRPREGAKHPKGRTDFYDRYIIERTPTRKGMRLQLVKYVYVQTKDESYWARHTQYYGAPYTKEFFPHQESKMLDYEEELREKAIELGQSAVEEHAQKACEKEDLKSFHATYGQNHEMVI